MWARLKDGKVVELVEIDPSGRFHSDLFFVECGANVAVGDVLSGGTEYDAAMILSRRAAIADISPRQVRLALNQLGLRAAVEAVVLAASTDTQDMWHYATAFKRTDVTLVAMAASLGMSNQQLDDIFLLAATL